MANIWHVFKIWILCTQMLRKTAIKMYIFVKHNFLKNYVSINFFLSGKSVVLFNCATNGQSCDHKCGEDIKIYFSYIRGSGGSYFPYILLNEIQTMFSQLAKRSARVLPTDLCTDHAHYIKNHRSAVLRRNKNMVVEGGTVSHYHILVVRKFIDCLSLFRHSVWFSFPVKQFPSAEFGKCNT